MKENFKNKGNVKRKRENGNSILSPLYAFSIFNLFLVK